MSHSSGNLSCPNCGAEQTPPPPGAYASACAFCQTTLLVGGADAGSSGTVHRGETLLSIGDEIKLGGIVYKMLGRAQFSYGRGLWDEFWAQPLNSGAPNDEVTWLSVDEGDLVLQRAISSDAAESLPNAAMVRDFKVGQTIQYRGGLYTIDEVAFSTCEGFEGAWPEPITIGMKYAYVNANENDGRLLSAEYELMTDKRSVEWFAGRWHSPFELLAKDIVRVTG